jgi:hypothetical protein
MEYTMRHTSLFLAVLSLTGCITMPPSAEDMARLPVVVFPDPPPQGDFILKLPAGRPIPLHVAVKGTMLTKNINETLTNSLVKDLYVHKEWASEDGKTWKSSKEIVNVNLILSLPSDAHPKPGELMLEVNQRQPQ